MLKFLYFSTVSRSPSSSLGMPQHFSLPTTFTGNAVVLEHRGQVFGQVRLVAIAVAGDEQRHLAAGLVGGLDFGRPCPRRARARLLPVFEWNFGIGAVASTPSVASSNLRPAFVPFTALTISATTGMPAMLPSPRVFDSSLSRKQCSPLRCCTCLARSIRCGKSMFQGCGGTYGHFVMKHMSHR